jgi:hypothetical protein
MADITSNHFSIEGQQDGYSRVSEFAAEALDLTTSLHAASASSCEISGFHTSE